MLKFGMPIGLTHEGEARNKDGTDTDARSGKEASNSMSWKSDSISELSTEVP
jgi:hypothetical protein